MPTKKTRVGFIPRNDVLDILNKLSYENNLSYSKIINILVEEALSQRGLLNMMNVEVLNSNKVCEINSISNKNKYNLSNEFNYNFKNKLLKDKKAKYKEVTEEHLDTEIYSKFLIFLEFQERMKKKDS